MVHTVTIGVQKVNYTTELHCSAVFHFLLRKLWDIVWILRAVTVGSNLLFNFNKILIFIIIQSFKLYSLLNMYY
jgi:hypothetical protein